jgi:hypothetical protein
MARAWSPRCRTRCQARSARALEAAARRAARRLCWKERPVDARQRPDHPRTAAAAARSCVRRTMRVRTFWRCAWRLTASIQDSRCRVRRAWAWAERSRRTPRPRAGRPRLSRTRGRAGRCPSPTFAGCGAGQGGAPASFGRDPSSGVARPSGGCLSRSEWPAAPCSAAEFCVWSCLEVVLERSRTWTYHDVLQAYPWLAAVALSSQDNHQVFPNVTKQLHAIAQTCFFAQTSPSKACTPV